MKLDLTEILLNVGRSMAYPVNEPGVRLDEEASTTGYKGSLRFTNSGGALLVEGRISSQLRLVCSRCLRQFEQSISFLIEEQFVIQIHGKRSAGKSVTIQEEDENPDAGRIFEGSWFDLTEMLRQHILLEIPIQPLHDENCSGLCPHCGQDLNMKSCLCHEDDMPSPFAILAKFR